MKVSTIFALGFICSLSATALAAPPTDAKPESPKGQKQVVGFMDVPKEHWAYNAATYLCEAGIVESGFQSRVQSTLPLSRYEFAVMLGRLEKQQQDSPKIGDKDFIKALVESSVTSQPQDAGDNTALKKEKCIDALDALFQEFRAELKILGVNYQSDPESDPELYRLTRPPRLLRGIMSNNGNYILDA